MILVIGAGLSGLSVAHALKRRGNTPVVLERRSRPGGRIRSVEGDEGRLLYEAGPWRIPDNHERVKRLFSEFRVPLSPLQTPTPKYGGTKEVVPGLSSWDIVALQEGPSRADHVDLCTGYADQTHSASGSDPYTTTTRTFHVAPDGFHEVVDRMAATVDVRYDCRVCDVRREGRQYVVTCLKRTGHNDFQTVTMRCHHLFVCVPPGVCERWDIFDSHAKSVMCAVEPCELHHIYADDPNFPRRQHRLFPESIVSQTISAQYEESPFFQISYTSGRLARFWQNLKLQFPRSLVDVLARELRRLTGYVLPRNPTIKSHHWPVGFHKWSTVPNFDMHKSVHLAVEPNPRQLPGVYLCGEAFSSHQAWMEGALETAELAVEAFFKRHLPRKESRLAVGVLGGSTGEAMVEGRRLNLESWAHVHPGGVGAIANHSAEDLTDLLSHVGHSRHAWAIVHSLKKIE